MSRLNPVVVIITYNVLYFLTLYFGTRLVIISAIQPITTFPNWESIFALLSLIFGIGIIGVLIRRYIDHHKKSRLKLTIIFIISISITSIIFMGLVLMPFEISEHVNNLFNGGVKNE